MAARGGRVFQAPQVLFALLGVCAAWPTSAASWRFVPAFDFAEIYSDNITLQPQGDQQDDFITEVAPSFALSAEGRRLNLTLDYCWQGLYYARNSDRSTSYHQLGAALDSILVKDLLFLEGAATYQQTLVTPTAASGQGNFAITGVRENVLTTHLSPYLTRRLGNWATTLLRYTADGVAYPNSHDRDSRSNGIDATLSKQKNDGRWSWALGYRAQTITYRSAVSANVVTRTGDFQLGYRPSRRIGFNGLVGYEKNDYPRAVDTAVPEGNYWDLGAEWQPTPRTTLAFGGGRRYFGNNWRLDLSLRGRRSEFSGRYFQELTTRRQYLLAPQLNASGQLIIDPDTLQPVLERLPLDEVYLRRRAQLAFSYRTRRTTSTLNMYRERREYQLSGVAETVRSGGLGWQWSPSQRAHFNLGVDLLLTQSSDYAQDRLMASFASFTRRLGRQLNASLEARRTVRDGVLDYTENLLTARIKMSW